MDVIFTHCVTERQVAAFRETFWENNPTFPGRVLHACWPEGEEVRGRLSKVDWLLCNVCEADFVVLVTEPSVLPLDALQKTVDAYTKPTQVGIFEVIPGLYFRNNPPRRIRYMDGEFAGRLPRVAFLVPMSFKGLSNPKDIPAVRSLSFSLEKTLKHSQMARGLYIGIDADERLPPKTLQMINQRFRKTNGFEVSGVVSFPVEYRQDQNMARMYNALLEKAMMDGYDFAVAISDDVRAEVNTWDRTLGAYLCSNSHAIGAYAMRNRLSSDRMDVVMVSRSHYDIFGYFANHRCPDTTVWLREVLQGYARMVHRLTYTNTVTTRRKRNKTDQIHDAYGLGDDEVVEKDRKVFERARQILGA